jgi:hypothetical protein
MKNLYYVILILFVAGCTTPYQQQNCKTFTGGYSEAKKGDNIYHVVFNGNGYTPLDKVKDYALLRSAEVTIENGFAYFRIDSSEATYVEKHSSSCYNGICTPIVTKAPTAFNVISCFKEKPKSKNKEEVIYNAKATSDEMKIKYKM